jgi:hypothetical protein
MLGGAIGLAIASNIFNNWLTSQLSPVLTVSELAAILDSTDIYAALPPDVQDLVRLVVAQGYNPQMKVITGLAGAQSLGVLMMWKRKQLEVP